MTVTTADILSEIKRQLEWRGPTGKGQGHVVLKREMAEFLHRRVIELVMELKEHRKTSEDNR